MTVPITLSDVTNLQSTTAVNTINSNNDAVTTAFSTAVYTAGDTMSGNLDMNSNRILNLPAPVSSNEPARLQDIANLSSGGSVTLSNLPTGGSSGQVLTKNSGVNYDANWATLPSQTVYVSGVTAGTGLDGGTITTTGSLSLSAARRTLPTTQSLTSGTNATYTTPTNCLWIEVFMVGGGGGGAGSASGTSGSSLAGNAGNSSSFNSIVAAGGGAATGATGGGISSIGGAGGSGGIGTATRRARGGPGGGGFTVVSNNPIGYGQGGQGGTSYFGGGGQISTGGGVVNGTAGDANSGAGGSGSSCLLDGSAYGIAGGGGAGEFVYLLINNPLSTYTYTIGTGGAGGIGGNTTGGAGGSGFIFVIEHYGS